MFDRVLNTPLVYLYLSTSTQRGIKLVKKHTFLNYFQSSKAIWDPAKHLCRTFCENSERLASGHESIL